MSHSSPERLWKRRATSLSRCVNSGFWLERFNLLATGVFILFVLLVLGFRTYRSEWFRMDLALVGLAIVLLGAAVLAWSQSRSRFIGVEEGLARLDDRLHLHNRLSSANRGVGAWADYLPDDSHLAAFRWNWLRSWLPGVIGLAAAIGACLITFPALDVNEKVAPVEPGAWEQMEDWVATLEEEQLIQEDALEEIAQKIEELREQPEEEWFSHSSLEATDTLADTLGRQLRDLASEMATLERDISALKNFSPEMSEETRQKLMKEYEEALEALESSGMAVNEELLKQLQEIDPSKLGKETLSKLSGEQLKQVQDQLRKSSGALGSMEGLPPMSEAQEMAMEREMRADEGMGGGAGGVDRGRGDAPLYFGDTEDNLGTNAVEQVTNDDLSKATIGEVLGLGETEREVDKTPANARDGGAVSSTGQGGEAVSREVLRPDEQLLLKRYFK